MAKRGATINTEGRFARHVSQGIDDGWWQEEEPAPRTQLLIDHARSVISYNQSPDVPFDRSINPYRGCEHGCPYCFARPTHSYLDLSPGLDFETKIFYKPDAPELLRKELSRPGYRPAPVALGINTDGWQPVEKKLGLTRQLLQILAEHRHPVSIVTKSALIARDTDILADMAKEGLVQVAFSLTTLQPELARAMEPRAATPRRRLQAMHTLAEAGVPVSVLYAPVIPHLNDAELEAVLSAAFQHGARWAGYVLLRLPFELKEVFPAWLHDQFPNKAEAVLRQLRELRGGELYRTDYDQRMQGKGVRAELLQTRFKAACKRFGFSPEFPTFNCAAFRVPGRAVQASLFD